MPTINIRWSDNTAELKKNLAQGLDQIEATKASVDKLVRSLSGDNLVGAAGKYAAAIEQIGGAAKLTGDQQERVNSIMVRAVESLNAAGRGGTALAEKFQSLANATQQVESPLSKISGALGVTNGLLASFGAGLSIGAVVSFGKAIVADADALVKMSDRTGISVQWLQKLQAVGDETGNTIDEMTQAINQMQNRLAGGDASAVKALEKLGLSFQALQTLSPDQQFVAISDALRKIQDPAQQVNVAMDLFGRTGAEVLPTLKKGFDDVKDSAVGMSDETVKAMDKAGDAIARWWRQAKGITAEAVVAFAELASVGFDPMARAAKRAGDAAAEQAKNLEKQGAETQAQIRATEEWLRTMQSGIGPQMDANTQAAIYEDRLRKQTEAQDKAREAAKKATEEYGRLVQKLRELEIVLPGIKSGMVGIVDETTIENLKKLTDGWDKAIAKINELNRGSLPYFIDGMEKVGTVFKETDDTIADAIARLGIYGPTLEQLASKAVSVGAQIQQGLVKVLADIPQLLAQAFTGGGNLLGAVQAIGTQIGSAIGGAIGRAFGGIGGPIGSAVGSLLGPLIGAIANIGGPSEAERGGRKAEADFEQQLARTLTAQERLKAGTNQTTQALYGLRNAFVEAGLSSETAARLANEGMASILAAETRGPAAVQAAIDAVNAKLETWRAAQQRVATGVDGVVTAFGKAGSYIPASMRATIQTLLQMQGLTDDERAKLQQLYDQSAPNFEALKQQAEGFGISLASLGPKFEQGDLETRTKKLTDFIGAATDAGGDLGGILLGLKDEISGVVNESIKFGTAIPENMRPFVKNLIDTGNLTDDNGEKITDLTTIRFEDTPLDKGLAGLNTALDDLRSILDDFASKLTGLDGKTFRTTVITDYQTTGFAPGSTPTPAPSSTAPTVPAPASSTSRILPFPVVPSPAVVSRAIAPIVVPQPNVLDRLTVLASSGTVARDPALLSELRAIRALLASDRKTVVEIAGKEVARAVNKSWDRNEAGTRTAAKDILGVA